VSRHGRLRFPRARARVSAGHHARGITVTRVPAPSEVRVVDSRTAAIIIGKRSRADGWASGRAGGGREMHIEDNECRIVPRRDRYCRARCAMAVTLGAVPTDYTRCVLLHRWRFPSFSFFSLFPLCPFSIFHFSFSLSFFGNFYCAPGASDTAVGRKLTATVKVNPRKQLSVLSGTLEQGGGHKFLRGRKIPKT